MNKKQIIEILEFLKMSYSNFGGIEDKLPYWEEDLKFYSYEDVKKRIKELMELKEFSTNAPTLTRIIGPLTKIGEKMENNDVTYFCQFCNRKFNDYDEMETHQDRCRSVQYILRQYKRFKLGQIDKRILYNMSEEEFDIKYKKLLRLVQEHTNDEREKKVIEFIFDPPTKEETKEFLTNKEV